MENTNMTWYHPKYYKELRRAGVQVNSSRPAHSRCNKSDQAISNPRATAGDGSVRPDPGLKLKETSCPDDKNPNPQASSDKLQARTHKPQASSRKRQAP